MTIDNLDERIKNMVEKGRAKKKAAGSAEPPAPIQLDFWEDGKRAAPNAVFRSSLFPALNNKQPRRFIEEEKLFSVSGVDVIFTGKQFDQTDLDVYLELLNLAKPLPLGTPVKFSAHALLKALGLATGGKEHKRLHSVLIRLCGGVVDMTDHKKRYFGQLLHGGIRDEITQNYEITINPKFAVLFGFGMWSTIDREQRRALGRNTTAKALHAYYASHTAPTAHRYDTLAGIAGLTDKNPRKIKTSIIKAHQAMKDAGFLVDFTPNAETIEAIIKMSASQTLHVIRKASQKPKNRIARARV